MKLSGEHVRAPTHAPSVAVTGHAGFLRHLDFTYKCQSGRNLRTSVGRPSPTIDTARLPPDAGVLVPGLPHGWIMAFVLQPWQLLLAALAGWVNEQQQQIIEFQRTEIAVLKEKLGKRRIVLNNDQRRRLAVKVKVRSRHTLALFPQDGNVILRGESQDPLRLLVEEFGLRAIAKDEEDLALGWQSAQVDLQSQPEHIRGVGPGDHKRNSAGPGFNSVESRNP